MMLTYHQPKVMMTQIMITEVYLRLWIEVKHIVWANQDSELFVEMIGREIIRINTINKTIIVNCITETIRIAEILSNYKTHTIHSKMITFLLKILITVKLIWEVQFKKIKDSLVKERVMALKLGSHTTHSSNLISNNNFNFYLLVIMDTIIILNKEDNMIKNLLWLNLCSNK